MVTHGSLDGLPVAYLGREALRANKLASGRAKDLADVEAIDQVARARPV